MKIRDERGFTLLEMVVAVGITAIVSAMAYQGLVRTLDAKARIEDERTFWTQLSLAFVRMDDDLRQSRNRAVQDTDGRSVPAFVGGPAGAGAAIELTRGGLSSVSGRRGDLQRVAYRWDNQSLERLTWPALDRSPQNRPHVSPIIPGIEFCRLRFYASDGSLWDVWPLAKNPESLPRGVEVDRKSVV